jgi:putative phosphoesterase
MMEARSTLLQKSKKIGLMADSHGNLDAMKACIRRLKEDSVDSIVHLGDFLDSQKSADVLPIIETIQANHVFTVKGNNDYQIENALKNGCASPMRVDHCKRVQSFLSSVPMRMVMGKICFAHSLPYDSIRSFYEPVDTGNADQAQKIFLHTDFKIIFSGHSHFPVLFRDRSGKVSREIIHNQSAVTIHPDERYIIIIGAVSEGECGLMDMTQMKYKRIRLT